MTGRGGAVVAVYTRNGQCGLFGEVDVWRWLGILAMIWSLTGEAEPLRIGGTGGALGVAEALAERYGACCGESPRVLPSLGTGGGVRALADGRLDIALAGRALSAVERRRVGEVLVFARTPLILAAHPGVGADSLDVAQLVAIYRGERVTWPDGTPCRPVLRAEYDTETMLLRGLDPRLDAALDRAFARPDLVVTLTAQDNAAVLRRVPGSFGYLTRMQWVAESLSLRVLHLGGRAPTLEALAAGRYPLVAEFTLVLATAPDERVRRFVDFVFSVAGRAVVEANGALVPPRPGG
ncbi:ABC transporter substrate-binding protein [Marichromatium sp. AB32]|uniref:Phosphate ABC transporter substrate-binding protein (PhoT family) n=2 Tax=Chromatiaceae TaxID=1046 RepID=A0A4V2W992_MARGR|nr:ABC transporter substrate-binding protein [Marichromatium sp. AB31]RNE93502.1 ABC transporter substrate-binding protein [Marichromatium sp. AB32]TCW34520.1 phosphate ABC transporter substrate-binding protein (PhoT family) [Marichromatium gracile]